MFYGLVAKLLEGNVFTRVGGGMSRGGVYVQGWYTMGPGMPTPPLHTVLTLSGAHQNTYGGQASGTHPTGILSCVYVRRLFMRDEWLMCLNLQLLVLRQSRMTLQNPRMLRMTRTTLHQFQNGVYVFCWSYSSLAACWL